MKRVMTTADIDRVSAARDRRRSTRNGTTVHDARVVRCAWLLTMLLERRLVTVERYKARWNSSVRSFRRDLATLRDAGVVIVTSHPSRGVGAKYELLGFSADHAA